MQNMQVSSSLLLNMQMTDDYIEYFNVNMLFCSIAFTFNIIPHLSALHSLLFQLICCCNYVYIPIVGSINSFLCSCSSSFVMCLTVSRCLSCHWLFSPVVPLSVLIVHCVCFALHAKVSAVFCSSFCSCLATQCCFCVLSKFLTFTLRLELNPVFVKSCVCLHRTLWWQL